MKNMINRVLTGALGSFTVVTLVLFASSSYASIETPKSGDDSGQNPELWTFLKSLNGVYSVSVTHCGSDLQKPNPYAQARAIEISSIDKSSFFVRYYSDEQGKTVLGASGFANSRRDQFDAHYAAKSSRAYGGADEAFGYRILENKIEAEDLGSVLNITGEYLHIQIISGRPFILVGHGTLEKKLQRVLENGSLLNMVNTVSFPGYDVTSCIHIDHKIR